MPGRCAKGFRVLASEISEKECKLALFVIYWVVRMDTNQQPRPLSPVKRLFIRSFAWGAGCGLVLVVVLTAFVLFEQRPKAWDTTALRVKGAKAEGLSRLNDKFDEVSSGITFSVDVENTTAADDTLPPTLAVTSQTRGSHSLHSSLLKLPSEYFLPSRHVTTISLDADDLCAANYPPQHCFDSYFKDTENLVIFDEAHKYEILIPVPGLTLPPGQTSAPPCKNGAANCEPWQRDWSKTNLKPGSVVTKKGTIVSPH